MRASRAVAAAPAASVTAPVQGRLARVLAIVRRIIGVPDYDTYLAHMHAHRPTCEVLSRREFEQQRMNDRYTKQGTRCC